LHHSFLSFPNGSDAQILNDFQKHETVFVSIYLPGERLTLRESRQPVSDSEQCRGRAGIATAKQFCQNISSWRDCAGPTQRQALKNLTIRMVAGFSEVAERKDFLVAGGGFEPPTFGL
jgi:hypothetical protein